MSAFFTRWLWHNPCWIFCGGKKKNFCMAHEKKKLGQILKKRGILTGTRLVRILDQQKLSGGRKLGEILIDEGIITEEILLEALREQFQVPIVDLAHAPRDLAALALISQGFAVEHLVLPLTILQVSQGKILVVAMEDPSNKNLIQKMYQITGHAIKPLLAGKHVLTQAIAEAYRNLPASTQAPTGAI
jgi:type IV pilus assembly protein PilB